MIEPEIRPTAPPADGRPGVSDYVLAMGHELRAPLNAVIGMSGLMLDGELSSRQRQYVRSIHAAGESLSTIINDLLDLTRLLANGLPVEPMPFDLKSMVEETAKVLSTRAEERGLALRVDWRPELPRHVVGDPGRTRQVLGNLVGHAVNATSQGEVAIRIAPDGERDGVPMVRFTVEDTGIGIPGDRLERVFDQYVPVDASPYRSFGVTGLGLRISAELIRLMRGEIAVESEVGKGTRFWFRLPLPVAAVGHDLVLEQPVALTGGRILIVEPDQAGRLRLSDQVESAGWSAAFTDDLGGVIDQLRQGIEVGSPYTACVFSDYAVRPAHAEIATRIKADEALAPVALVMVTAVGSPGEGKRLWHAGFAAYLRKPLPTEELHDMLIALGQVRKDGRGGSLITRHSLAEIRNATPAMFDGIDEMLASLTAPMAERVLLIGAGTADQIEATESFALAGLGLDLVSRIEDATLKLAEGPYTMVVVDTTSATWEGEPSLARLREHSGAGATTPIVVFVPSPAEHDRMLEIGVDEAIVKPVQRSDLDRVIRRWTSRPGSGEPESPGDRHAVAAALGLDLRTDEPDQADHSSVAAPKADQPATAVATEVEDEPTVSIDEEARFTVAPGDQVPLPLGAAFQAQAPEPTAVDTVDPVEEVTTEPDAAQLDLEQALAVVEEEDTESETDDDDAEVERPADLLLAEVVIADSDDEVPLEGLVGNDMGDAGEHLVDGEPLDVRPAGADLGAGDDGAIDTIEVEPPGAVIDPPVAGGEPSDPPVHEKALDYPDDSASHHPIALLAPPPVPGDADASSVGEAGDDGEPLVGASDDRPTASGPEYEIGTMSIILAPDGTASDRMAPVAGRAVTVDERATPASDQPVVGTAILEQLAGGPGIFAQQVVGSFLRDAPQRIAELATAAGRGDLNRMMLAVQSLKSMGGLLGAGRLVEHCFSMESALEGQDLEAASGRLGDVENAFLEIRAALEEAAPPGAAAPADLPAVGAVFLDQLGPERDEAGRALARRLSQSFRQEAPDRLAELKDAVTSEDAARTMRLAQSLKSMCGMIGADPMAKLCALVEADARLRRVAQARRYLDQLMLELERIDEVLERSGG